MGNNKNVSTLSQIEAKMTRYAELQGIIMRAEVEKELLKHSLLKMMKDEQIHSHTVNCGDGYCVKATAGETTRRVFDHEQMAEDLGISVSATKDKKVIVQLVEEGALTSDKFNSYYYNETTDKILLRRNPI